MTAKDATENGATPSIRDLQLDEIDSVSGGIRPETTTSTPSWTDPDPTPVQNPKSPGWTDPDPSPVR